jgi:hypothetical protein
VRHRDIQQGTRAIKRVAFPLVNVPSAMLPDDVPELAEQRARDQAAASPGQALPEVPVPEVGLRVLTGTELKIIAAKAREFSGQTPDKVNEEDPLYALGKSAYTLALACVDPNSDPVNPTPFFGEPGDVDGAAREILDSVNLGRDGITYLAEAHELWQDLCNPQALRITGQRMSEVIGQIAADPDFRSFLALRPGMRWLLLRTMAALLVNLQSSSSVSGESSTATN